MCFGFKGLIGKWTGHITQNTKHILNTAECFVFVFFSLLDKFMIKYKKSITA